MPQMNGQETLERLRSLRPDVPVILTSGGDEGPLPAQESPQAVTRFIQKPFVLGQAAGGAAGDAPSAPGYGRPGWKGAPPHKGLAEPASHFLDNRTGHPVCLDKQEWRVWQKGKWKGRGKSCGCCTIWRHGARRGSGATAGWSCSTVSWSTSSSCWPPGRWPARAIYCGCSPCRPSPSSCWSSPSGSWPPPNVTCSLCGPGWPTFPASSPKRSARRSPRTTRASTRRDETPLLIFFAGLLTAGWFITNLLLYRLDPVVVFILLAFSIYIWLVSVIALLSIS